MLSEAYFWISILDVMLQNMHIKEYIESQLVQIMQPC